MKSKRIIGAAVVAALLGGMIIVTAGTAVALSSDESQFVSSHNSIRSQYGRRALSVQSDLTSIARHHSAEMASKGEIWHNPRLGQEVQGWDVVGENVGMGPSVPDLMDAFMNSPAHKSNIIDTDYNQFGIGVVVSQGTIYVTVVFAHRGTSASVTTTRTTTTRPRTTTTRPHRVAAAAAKPVAHAAPAAPAPVAPPVRTVSMLVAMNGLDSVSTGAASG